MRKSIEHDLTHADGHDLGGMTKNKRKQFLVAGLGLFGTSVAVNLQRMSYEVYAHVNIVAIKREGKTIVNPKAQEVFQPEDEIIVLGTHAGIKRMGVDF